MKLELRGCGYRAGGADLLHATDFELAGGELVAVLGPNGAGKSTLLKLMSGELAPGTGGVYLDGRPVTEWPLTRLATCLGVLPQHSELSFPFRVEEVVGLGRIPHASGHDRDGEIVHELLTLLDLAAVSGRDYTTLSGGEQQRTQIARVLAQIWDRGAECALLMDEPSAYLDLAHQLAALRIVKGRVEGGAAALLILHDINLAARFADRVVLLHRGRIEAVGTPWEVLTTANVERVFGVPAAIIRHPGEDRPLIIAD